jgi:4-phosphopantoate--beta-alanine ligase
VKIPKSHPRHESLVRREALVKGWRDDIVVPEGLIAHGRGEAWDYLFGEGTTAPALVAERAAAALLVRAKYPVISVNGNVAALAVKDVVRLAKAIPARIEVNLFHRSEARVKRIVHTLQKAGAREVLGPRPDARIPGLESKRALCHREGIYRADVVLVPLEDGDRAEALARMGKAVIAIDLNPLSRTSQAVTVPIVDELSRGLRNLGKFVRELKEDPREAQRLVRVYRKEGNLRAVYAFLGWRLRLLGRKRGPAKG